MEINILEDRQLREYQLHNKTEIYKLWKYHRSVMLQMPTGTGKTRLFASIVKDIHHLGAENQKAYKVLILVHRQELVDQIAQTLGVTYGVAHGIIMSGTRQQMFYPTQIASIQTLNRRLDDWREKEFDFIIIDEAHHALADSYKKICKIFSNAKILGVTATPYRLSGESFKTIFQEIVISSRISKFIEDGYLSKYDYYSIAPTSAIQKAIDEIETFDIDGDYAIASMSKVVDTNFVQSKLLDAYLKYAKGKKGIVYTINKAHNLHVCEAYNDAGFAAKAIDSDTKPDERIKILQLFKTGKVKILCNVNIFSEGFDCPDIEFIQLARPTTSLSLYLQQVGRGLRIHPDIERVIFLDNVGSYNKYGLPSSYRNWERYFSGHNPRIKDEKENKETPKSTICKIFEIDSGEEIFVEGNKLIDLIYSNDGHKVSTNAIYDLTDFDGYEEFYIPIAIDNEELIFWHFMNYDYERWTYDLGIYEENDLEIEIEGDQVLKSTSEQYHDRIKKVKINEKLGLYNSYTKELELPIIYEEIEGPNILGKSIIKRDGKCGVYCCHSNKLLIDCTYDEIEFIRNKMRHNQCIVTENEYDSIICLSSGDIIHQGYNFIVAFEDAIFSPIKDDLLAYKRDKYYIIDASDKVITKCEKIKSIGNYFTYMRNEKIGICNKYGFMLSPAVFDDIKWHQSLIICSKKYGDVAVYKDGLSLLFSTIFSKFQFYGDKYIVAKKQGNGCGIIDVDENVIIDFKYDDVVIKDGVICAKINNIWNIIDLNGIIYASSSKIKDALEDYKNNELYINNQYVGINIQVNTKSNKTKSKNKPSIKKVIEADDKNQINMKNITKNPLINNVMLQPSTSKTKIKKSKQIAKVNQEKPNIDENKIEMSMKNKRHRIRIKLGNKGSGNEK